VSSFSSPSKPGLDFQLSATTDEHRFWNGMEMLNLGARRDELIQLEQNVEWETLILRKKWETMTVENLPLLTLEKQATALVKGMVDKTIEQKASVYQKSKESTVLTHEWIKDRVRWLKEKAAELAAKKTGLKEDYAKLVAEVVAEMIRKFGGSEIGYPAKEMLKVIGASIEFFTIPVKSERTQRVVEYNEKIRCQTEGILVVFMQTRKESDEFIKKNGFPVAKQRYEEVRKALDDWLKELPTQGLKDDGKEIVDAFVAGLSQLMRSMETTFNQFIKENEGRFFGPVGPQIDEELWQTRQWETDLATLASRGKDLEETLSEWRSANHQFLEFDLRYACEELSSAFRELPEEVQKDFRPLLEAFTEEVKKESKALMEGIDRTAEEVKRLSGRDGLLLAFDRKLLEDKKPR
jgi:hypothetical protein